MLFFEIPIVLELLISYFFLLESTSTLILQLTSAFAKVKAVIPLPIIQTVIIFLILTIKIR